jgi:phospholipid-transporting ATPase
MFIHGREAYRRNSFLVLYTFYKNVLYISTQFYFGFRSAFSGQPLYEPFIYQLYNVTMTSFPIMYYACFDFEYEKSDFLKVPTHFKLGLNNECYSVKIFLQYVLYGLWHALVLYFTGFQALLQTG